MLSNWNLISTTLLVHEDILRDLHAMYIVRYVYTFRSLFLPVYEMLLKMEQKACGNNGSRCLAPLAGLTFTACSPSSVFNLYDKAKTHQEELHSS